jgi:hypothetical protein
MKIIDKIIQENICLLKEEYIHAKIMEDIKASLSQKEMPNEFKEINKQIWGDVDKEKRKEIENKYAKNSLEYNINAKKPELGKRKAPIETEVKGSVFPFGNVKLSHNVLIINMTSAQNCPSAAFCPIGKSACYAYSDEKYRKDYYRRNIRNELMFDQARENPAKWKYIFWFIRKYIEKALNCGLVVTHIRLNEAGDFKTVQDVEKFDEFAAEMKKDYGIETHAYTANKNLIDALNKVKNININASIPDITGDKVYRHFYGIQKTKLNKLPDTPLQSIATPLLGIDKKYGYYYKCPCDISKGAKCFNCQVCWLAKPGIGPNGEEVPRFKVLCAIHGKGKGNYNSDIADKKRNLPTETETKNIKKMVKVSRNAEKKQ